MSTAYGPGFQDSTTADDGTQDTAGQQAQRAAQFGYGSVPPPPPPPVWPGYGSPGWPVTPAYQGTGGDGPRRRRRRGLAITAGVAVVALAAAGTAWANSGSGTLSTADVASRVDPALVDVISTLGYQHGTALGTGMVLTPNGEVLTNNHVVAGATSIQVRDIGNGRSYTAKVVGYSDSNDVAVLQLSGASGLKTVTTGDSGTVAVGQKVVALGNAEGKNGTPSVATGTVTALGTTITAADQGSGTTENLTGMIRTNAGIQPGDSGGPLVNGSGQVVGMNTAASSSNLPVGTTAVTTTAAFSIPINRALTIADLIEADKSSSTVHIGETGFLGVAVAQAGANGLGSGVTIEGALAGTAAAQAGLTVGDSIVSVNGHQVSSGSDLQGMIERYHPGDKVTIGWLDQFGQPHTATVTLTAGPAG